MPLKLKGATSGDITLDVPAAAGTNTLTFPAKTGNIITSADSGTVTQAMLGSGVAGNGPAFYAYLNADQTITSSTFTKVQLTQELFDTNNNFDSASNYRFTPTVAGYYQINACMSGFNSTSPTRCFATIYKNGSQYGYGTDVPVTGGTATSTGATLVYLNGSTDYIEMYAYIVATTAKVSSAGGAATYTYMTGSLVRAA
jgi:hypothetical protein